jgi:hypothetical protein
MHEHLIIILICRFFNNSKEKSSNIQVKRQQRICQEKKLQENPTFPELWERTRSIKLLERKNDVIPSLEKRGK